MASEEVEQAVPPHATEVRSTRTVDLPATIRGAEYSVRVDGRSLVIDHPDPSIRGRSDLALPSTVLRISGEWKSTENTVVTVRSISGGLAIELREAHS